MGCPRLVIGDGHLGIWGALRNVYPQAEEQRCWKHRIVNLLTKLPKRVHKPALLILRQIPYAETREEAQRLKQVFQHWCRQRGLRLRPDRKASYHAGMDAGPGHELRVLARRSKVPDQEQQDGTV